MRVESMSSRLDFDERRARALEGVVQYRPGAVAPLQPPAGGGEAADQRRRRSGRAPRDGAAAGGGAGRGAGRASATAVTAGNGAGDGAAPASGEAPDRRRERERGDAERIARAARRRTTSSNREARGRRPALRRRHQRRRRAARALHRRTAGAARRGRGGHDLRARLRDLAERAAGRRRDRSTASPVRRFPGRPRARSARIRPPLAARLRPAAFDRRRARLARERRARRARRWSTTSARGADFDFVLLFSYRYYHAWHGARRLPRKAVLVPTAERDPAIGAGDLRPGVPRRARGHVQLARRARDDPGGDRQRRRARRRRRRRLGRARRGPTPARFRRKFNINRPFAIYIGRIDENKGCGELFELLPALRGDVPARPRPGARRQRDHAGPEAPAHPPPRLPRRRGQVRRAGRRRPADHAVVLREPVDGRARSLGARPAGARQRPLRRAQGPVHPQQRRAVLRELRGVRRDAVRARVERPAARARSAGTAASTSRGTTPGR